MKRLTLTLLIGLVLLPLLCLSTAAQTTSQQFWPETDFYQRYTKNGPPDYFTNAIGFITSFFFSLPGATK